MTTEYTDLVPISPTVHQPAAKMSAHLRGVRFNRAAIPLGLLRPAPGRNLTAALARVSDFASHRVISVTL